MQICKKIYDGINSKFYEMPVPEAEILKYLNNSFHALKITFANEIGYICKKLEIDSHKIMEIFIKDNKLNISPAYLKPGFAYGGSCLPKDLKALTSIAHEHYIDTPLLNSISVSNKNQINGAIELIMNPGKKKIGFLGISFKAGTDDVRNSPVIEVIEQLLGKGYEIKIYDKNINISKLLGQNKNYVEEKLPHLNNLILNRAEQVIESSEVVVVSTNEKEFYNLNIPPEKYIIDFVRIKNFAMHINYQGICW